MFLIKTNMNNGTGILILISLSTAAVLLCIYLTYKVPVKPVTPFTLYSYSNWRLSANDPLADKNDPYFPIKQAPPELRSHNQIKCGDVVYCESSETIQLMNLLKDLSVPIILVTGRSHLPSFVSDALYICKHPFIRKWFTQNPLINNPKVEVIPYGIQPQSLPNFLLFMMRKHETRTIPVCTQALNLIIR